MFIGRGKDFAWSLTSADSENTQEFLEKLCNQDESPPTRESTATSTTANACRCTCSTPANWVRGLEPARELEVLRNGPRAGQRHGAGGRPALRDRERPLTRGREPEGELAFSKLDSDKVHNPQEFFEAANELETTFNMAYLDNKHIAYFSTGRLPMHGAGHQP